MFAVEAKWAGSPTGLSIESELYYPDSLADLYTRVTELLGFTPDADEHKTQWLSADGDLSLLPLFQKMIGTEEVPRFDRAYFDPARLTLGGFSSQFFQSIGAKPDGALSAAQRASVAAGLQRAIELEVLKLAGPAKNLCMAGGLGFNAFLITALEGSGRFQNVFVQPAAGKRGHRAWSSAARLARFAACIHARGYGSVSHRTGIRGRAD